MKKTIALIASLGMAAMLAGCATTPGQGSENTKKDAVIGGLLGAAAGAVIGHQSGHALEGAAVGAGVGAVGGGVVGSAKDEKNAKLNVPNPNTPTVTVPPGVNR